MRILMVGGAGAMGSGTVRDLISPLQTQVAEVVIADSRREAAAALVAALGDPRLRATDLDVTDGAALRQQLAQTDLCVNAVPTFAGHQTAIFEACLETRTTYVDFGGMGVFTVRQKQADAAWRAAGVTAILGLGADPGISNMLCKAVAEQFDTLDSINLYWAAKNLARESPVLVPPYSLATVIAEYANPSMQFLDGALRQVPPQSGQEVLLLPEPWGRTEFMFTQHSEPLTVPFAKGIRDKGIREFTWKLHMPDREHEAWVGLCKAGFGDFDEAIEVDGVAVRPGALLEAVIRRNLDRNGHLVAAPETHELHLAVARGMREGRPARHNCAVVGRPNAAHGAYADPATSIGLAVGVQLLLRDRQKPGVWGPEEYFDAEPFFTELQKRHFAVVRDLHVADEAEPGHFVQQSARGA